MLSDRLFFPLITLVIISIVAIAAVWPQGDGARSPAPFGHTPTQQTPAAIAARSREAAVNAADKARSAAAARKDAEAAARTKAALQ